MATIVRLPGDRADRTVSHSEAPSKTVVSRWRARIEARLAFEGARLMFKKPLAICTDVPIISFTFDDFPRSALLEGGAILEHFGVAATYYVSLGLAGKQAPPGQMFLLDDLYRLLERGHELGCHTFSHCHSWDTPPEVFESSVMRNRLELQRRLPGASFRSLSYPNSAPRPGTKRRMAQYFDCCRGGGHTLNAGTADLTFLRAYFLERAGNSPEIPKRLIDRNRRELGWLILATHDICERPSPYGCTPEYFASIVRYAIESGARVMPVGCAYDLLTAQV